VYHAAGIGTYISWYQNSEQAKPRGGRRAVTAYAYRAAARCLLLLGFARAALAQPSKREEGRLCCLLLGFVSCWFIICYVM
jgi:hypothetical protein